MEEVCTITAKGQTTVPKAVRQALGVGYGGRIAFRVQDGVVTVVAAQDPVEEDPALAPFLALIEADIAARPGHAVLPFPARLLERLAALRHDAPVDIDVPIEGEVGL